MSKAFSITLEGFENLKQILTNLPKETFEKIDGEVEGAMYDIQANTKRRCPNNLGGLANSVTNPEKLGEMKWELSVQKFYAPYVNFGTGLYASQFLGSQDEEWNAYAMQFYVNGKGRIHGNGFFTNSVNEGRIKLINKVKDILLGK